MQTRNEGDCHFIDLQNQKLSINQANSTRFLLLTQFIAQCVHIECVINMQQHMHDKCQFGQLRNNFENQSCVALVQRPPRVR